MEGRDEGEKIGAEGESEMGGAGIDHGAPCWLGGGAVGRRVLFGGGEVPSARGRSVLETLEGRA